MTSDQQDSDLNNSVQKTGTGLNPNADAFHYPKALTSESKDWEPGEELLTNGDLKQDEAGGGFSSGETPLSDSPPEPSIDTSLDMGAPPPDFIADSMVGTPAAVSVVVGAETTSIVIEEGIVGPDQNEDPSLAQAAIVHSTVVTTPAPLTNGFGPFQAAQDSHEAGVAGSHVQDAANLPASPEDLHKQLLAQLEYYFSRVNLVQDHYLQSQMDGDQYVPIATIANFNQVVKLTRDYNLIVEILRSSKLVQVDESGTKVRPKHNRSVLMLREIPETTLKSEIEELFNSEHCPKLVSCEFAHNGYWYITFNTDEDARDAFVYLRQYEIKFKEKPVLARIKAKPLVRAPGGVQFPPNKNPSRQHQESAVSYMRQPQNQYPVLTPMSQFVNQQQVPQNVQPFHPLYNYTGPMIPQWGAPNTSAPTFLDPGAMLALNGYHATSIKPSASQRSNVYPVRSSNSRGGQRPHRSQITNIDKTSESRPMDRPYSNSMSSARASPRNNNQHTSEPHALPPPFARSRSDGSASNNGHFSGQSHGSLSTGPTPLVPEESLPPHTPVQSTPSSKPDAISTSVQPKRGGNFRRSRRNDEGAKNSRSNPTHASKDGKPHEPHFELEATSFPPLPGSTNNSSSSDAPEGNKLSDVVKGTARPHTRFEEKPKTTAAPSSTASTLPTCSFTMSTAAVSTSTTDSSQITNQASTITSAAIVSASASVAAKETEVSASVSFSAHFTPTTATAVETSAHPSKNSKSSTHPSSLLSSKPVSEVTVAAKQVTACSAALKTPAQASSTAPITASASEIAPAKLSYAQMVARKQQAENAAKQNFEEGVSLQATPSAVRTTTQITLREQSQTQAAASVSASAPPKSASASARPSAKELAHKDFEPKEQRFQGGRRAKENRDSRQPRFDRRRSDRDVKVPAK